MSGQLYAETSAAHARGFGPHGFIRPILLLFSLVIAAHFTGDARTRRQRSGGSEKKSKDEFVPGEVLVRYRTEAIAKQQTQRPASNVAGEQIVVELRRAARLRCG